MSSWCATICSTQILTIPLSNKEFLCKLIFTTETPSSHLKDICSIEFLFIVLVIARLTWSITCSLSSSLRLLDTSYLANLESSTNSTRTLLRLFAPWESSRFYPPRTKSLGSPASQSSSLLIREDHMLNRGHSSSLRWRATCLTWSAWSMVTPSRDQSL